MVNEMKRLKQDISGMDGIVVVIVALVVIMVAFFAILIANDDAEGKVIYKCPHCEKSYARNQLIEVDQGYLGDDVYYCPNCNANGTQTIVTTD
jgi:DNA-directed RNA polymerase subunit RPC12/RpoP